MEAFKIIPYARHEITQEDKQAVLSALDSDYLTQGPLVPEFEAAICQVVNAPYGVALANGTAALHIACLALEKLFSEKRAPKKKKKVITSALTFAASSNCALYAGLEPEFVDIDPATLCLDTEECIRRIKARPDDYVGVVPVSFAGLAVDMEKLSNVCRECEVWVLEDACHAIGAWRLNERGQKVFAASCVYSDAAVLSFHPAKHVASGEGGVILSRNQEIAELCTILRTHGIKKNIPGHPAYYMEMVELGFNYRIPDLLCALGLSQLKRVGESLERRNQIAEKYQSSFDNFKAAHPAQAKAHSNNLHAYHLFILQCEARDELYEELKKDNIYCQIHYIPVYRHPYYKNRNLGDPKNFPHVEKYFSGCLSLPMYPSLTDNEQTFVIERIQRFYESRF